VYNKKLRTLNGCRINSYLGIIESLDNQIKDISKKILLIAKQAIRNGQTFDDHSEVPQSSEMLIT
jgi:hypothetical protein